MSILKSTELSTGVEFTVQSSDERVVISFDNLIGGCNHIINLEDLEAIHAVITLTIREARQ